MRDKIIELALAELARMAALNDTDKIQVELPEIDGVSLLVTLEFEMVGKGENKNGNND